MNDTLPPHNDDDDLDNNHDPHVDLDDIIIQRRDDDVLMRDMNNIIDQAERVRLKHMKTHHMLSFSAMLITIVSVMSGAAGFVWFFLVQAYLPLALACLVAGMVVPVILNLLKGLPLRAYKTQHKERFMPQMAKALGGFRYYPKRGIGAKVLQKSGITLPFARYDSEDCFIGRYKGIKVLFSEAKLYRTKKGEPSFDGLLVLLELPQPRFKGKTIITADQALAHEQKHTAWAGLHRVETSQRDADWKKFQCFSSRPDLAIEYASEHLLKELSEARNIFGQSPISIVLFAKKYVFLAIPTHDDMFEACNLFLPITLQSYIKKCKSEVHKLLEVMDIFEFFSITPDEHT